MRRREAGGGGRGTSCMSDERTFVDTNVFVYMFDDAEPAKRDLARACIEAVAKGAAKAEICLQHGRADAHQTKQVRHRAELLVDGVQQGLRRGRCVFAGRDGQAGHGSSFGFVSRHCPAKCSRPRR